MPTSTSVPCRGRISEYREETGVIETEHGTKVKFGRTSCSGFEPRVGVEVWVMATRMMPVIGERAALVNLTGAAEPTDAAERGRLMREASEREWEAKRAAKATVKATFRERAARSDLPAGWQPGVRALGEAIELTPLVRALAELDEHAGARNAARHAKAEAVRTQVPVTAVFDTDRGDDELAEIRFGPCEPWPIADPCLVPFAQIDGEEPNLFALFFHPELHRERRVLPVVLWDHEVGERFIAEDPAAFVGAIVHGTFTQDDLEVAPRRDLAHLIGSALAHDFAPRAFPKDLKAILERSSDERRALRALVELSRLDEFEAVSHAADALARRYRELGWPYHARHVQFQLRRFLAE